MTTKTDSVLQPKRRWRPVNDSSVPQDEIRELKIAVAPASRPPRMKRSASPHQMWATPALELPQTIETGPVTPVLQEIAGLLARACLQPLQSYYSR